MGFKMDLTDIVIKTSFCCWKESITSHFERVTESFYLQILQMTFSVLFDRCTNSRVLLSSLGQPLWLAEVPMTTGILRGSSSA